MWKVLKSGVERGHILQEVGDNAGDSRPGISLEIALGDGEHLWRDIDEYDLMDVVEKRSGRRKTGSA